MAGGPARPVPVRRRALGPPREPCRMSPVTSKAAMQGPRVLLKRLRELMAEALEQTARGEGGFGSTGHH